MTSPSISKAAVCTAPPHAGQPVLTGGPKPVDARLTIILVHGRGASADDILGLAEELRYEDLAYLAPQAAGHAWYPLSFLAPIPQNEPGISSGLGVLSRMMSRFTIKAFIRSGLGYSDFRKADASRWNSRPVTLTDMQACSP